MPEYKPERGWLKREIEAATREVKRWPAWMRHAAAFEPYADDAATVRVGQRKEKTE